MRDKGLFGGMKSLLKKNNWCVAGVLFSIMAISCATSEAARQEKAEWAERMAHSVADSIANGRFQIDAPTVWRKDNRSYWFLLCACVG